MPVGPGTRLGPYEIVAAIGAGGMGEVYRARDARLGRDVAIKVLPEAFASDPDRLARFEREAQLLASLNHPNIAIIHGLEESGGVRALVMELVEGPTLADRIAQGPLPLDEALPIARQIAEALEAAHERGVIHRDLKPANIKITPSGQVKVLDFGLAKMLEGAGSGQQAAGSYGLTLSPTLSVQATYAGVILGTAAYMSPEQARGKPVDRRADIWAFGCVFFEMLTRKQAFDAGETVSDAVAAILKNEPDWNALPAETPGNIRTLLRRCLEKDPQKRLPHISIARIEIDEPSPAPGTHVAPRSRRSYAWPLAVVAIVAMLLVFVSLPWLQDDEPPGDAPEMRTEIVTPAANDVFSFALSPDGRELVYAASVDGISRLWLRRLESESAQLLPGTEGASYPFWSPDSRSVAFFAGTKLDRVDIGGGSPQVLVSTGAAGRGGTWNRDGVILFASNAASAIFRISAAGGEVTPVTTLVRQVSHRFPRFLPDGRQFIFFAVGTPDSQGIYLGSLDSNVTKRIVATDGAAAYAPSGSLLWLRGSSLVAQRLDPVRHELVGNAATVADPVGFEPSTGSGAFSVSASGLMAYRIGTGNRTQLTWFDQSGKTLGVVGPADDSGLSAPRVSPDGRRVAISRTVQGNADIWVVDANRATRFTFDPTFDRFPLWSPDGARILFDSNRKGTRDLYMKAADGGGSDEVILESALDKSASDWSPDGRYILYRSIDSQTGRDLWILPLETRKPWLFLKTNFEENLAYFSPDGRWIAYQSNESGRFEIYLRPFIAPSSNGGLDSSAATQAGGQWQVSTNGGIQPRWARNGRELYYLGPGGEMMAATIKVTGTTADVDTPRTLFRTHIWGGGVDIAQGDQYDVTKDGRFLVNTVLDEATAPITILQNWKPPSN